MFVGKEIGQSKTLPVTSSHSEVVLVWGAEEEVGLDSCYDMRMVKGKVVHQVVPRSPVKGVCPVRLAVYEYNPESPAVDELELE